jgi:carbamoyltransferase
MAVDILGISAFYHDSAACLIRDGRIVAAAQEERFTRKKHDSGFPGHAISYCLQECKVQVADLDSIVFYDKPLLKFDRLLETYLAFSPRGLRSFLVSMPVWLREKLMLKGLLQRELSSLSGKRAAALPQILFTEHHESHAASAFFPSPFSRAAILCMDGVGEWATTSAWTGEGNHLTPLWEIPFPHSLGLLYSAFTYYLGFKVNSGEYKVMGLAPYGKPIYIRAILDQLLDLKSDGTFRLNLKYFNYCTGLTMTNGDFDALFDGPPRRPEAPLTQREMDLARSIQEVTEQIVLRLTRTLHAETKAANLCLAGGVALNCVANGTVLREGPFSDLWIQPAAGDAGGSIGAALAAWYQYKEKPRTIVEEKDSMQGSLLGPSYTNEEIEQYLQGVGACYKRLDEGALLNLVAEELASGKVVGWFQGRMEFGPRALGNRSILGDPRNPGMQSIMNLKIKHRESFRPFAPSILGERLTDYFDLRMNSPYMLLVAPVQERRRTGFLSSADGLWGIDLLKLSRSEIPAVTHVDYSARIQTVHQDTNPRFYRLLKFFETKTGCPILINTSFNVRGEPIVCSPEDAYRCFMRTEMDTLVLEDCMLLKKDQPLIPDDQRWITEYELD